MLRTLAINSNQIVLSFGVLIAFLSPKQSEIEKSFLESISKSRIQGVRDPAHSIRLPPLYIRLPPLYIRPTPFHPDGIRNYAPPPFPPGWHPEFCCRRHSIRMSYIRNSGARWERRRFNFSGYTYPDRRQRLPREFRSQFCTVARCSPEASRYVRPTSLDIFL